MCVHKKDYSACGACDGTGKHSASVFAGSPCWQCEGVGCDVGCEDCDESDDDDEQCYGDSPEECGCDDCVDTIAAKDDAIYDAHRDGEGESHGR